MALDNLKGNKVRKQDILTSQKLFAKNEIDHQQIDHYILETAELRVQERKDLTLAHWRDKNKLLNLTRKSFARHRHFHKQWRKSMKFTKV